MHQEIGVLVNGKYVAAVEARYRPEKYQSALQAARDSGHVQCMCVDSGLRLVVKMRAGKLHLAAWPDQAHMHSQLCPFFTPEGVNSKAVVPLAESIEHQKYRRSDELTSSGEHAADVRLWFVLHELWEKSLMNRWVPSWRRDWTMARRHLIRASKEIAIDGVNLASRLYLPQTFTPARREEINLEWSAFTAPLLDRPRGSAETASAFVLGVVAEVNKDSRGFWIRLQHHREAFFVSSLMWMNLSRLSRRGWSEISNGTVPKGRVVTLLRVEAMSNLHFAAADCVLMRVSEKYIPANLDFEDLVIRMLLDEQRSFYRPLSYAQSHGVQPNFVVTDTVVKDCDLYVTGSGFPQHRLPGYTNERMRDSTSRGRVSWHWAKSNAMPALPAAQTKHMVGR